MNEASVEFGISVIIVTIFHWVKKWIPWIEHETEKSLKIISITVAVLSSSFITFGIIGHKLIVELDMPIFIQFLLNTATQHGMSQIYHNVVFKRPSRNVPIELTPKMAGPIPFK